MLEDGTNPEDEIGGTIDPPDNLAPEGAEDESLDPGTIDPPNN